MGFDVDSMRAYHDEQRAAREAAAQPVLGDPKVGDAVRFSIAYRPNEPRIGKVTVRNTDDGIEQVYIAAEDFSFGTWINVASFDPRQTDEVYRAEIIPSGER